MNVEQVISAMCALSRVSNALEECDKSMKQLRKETRKARTILKESQQSIQLAWEALQCDGLVQVEDPLTGHYLLIDTERRSLIERKHAPYDGVPIEEYAVVSDYLSQETEA